MKKIAAILCGALVATSAVCSATVAPDTIGIGKVTPGMSTSRLTSLCGKPVSKHGDDWIYSNFKVEIEKNKVQEIETQNTTAPTPLGVTVGQNVSVLSETYGTADRVESEWNEEEYEYYSHDYSMKIEFKVHNGYMTKIICEMQD